MPSDRRTPWELGKRTQRSSYSGPRDSRPSEPYWRARAEENARRENTMQNRWRMREEFAESTSRKRSPARRSPTRSPPQLPTPPPRPSTPPPMAPRMETETRELERKLKERDCRITYLENLAERTRRGVEERDKNESNHLWSNKASLLSTIALDQHLVNYERKAAGPDFGTPYDYSSESDDMFSAQAAVATAVVAKRAKRRAALKRGRWVSRTLSQSSHEREPVGAKERKQQKPLEERFDPWVAQAQPGPYHRDQQGGSSSSMADQWHRNVQGVMSHPDHQSALNAEPPHLAAQLEHTPPTMNTGSAPTGPVAMTRAP